MEFNIYKIYQALEIYQPELFANHTEVQFRSCELLATAFPPYLKETIYIAEKGEDIYKLPVEHGFSVICDFKKRDMYNYPELIGVREKYNYIFLEQPPVSTELYSFVKKKISDYYSLVQLSEDLFQAVNSNAGIQRLADLVFSYTNNSVYVFDTGFQLLAMKEGANPSPPELDEINGKLYLADFDMKNVNFMHNHEKMKTERKPRLVQNAALGPDRITCMIDYDRDIGHFVFVEDGEKFDAQTYEYVALFQRALHLYCSHDSFSQNAKGFPYEYFLKDLLSQKYVGSVEIDSRTKYLDTSFSKNLFCFVIPAERTPEGIRYENVRGQIEAILPAAVTIVYESQIVAVVTGYKEYRMNGAYLEKLSSYCAGNNLYCGMSNAFSNIIDLYQYYKQALRAIEAGTGKKNTPGLFVYEKLHLLHLVNVFSSIEDVETFCCPQIKALMEYDKKNETELAKTLYYFLLFGNTKDTASYMYVHRNTILYRMRLINELIGEDYSDLALRHYLMISYELLMKIEF